MMWDSCTIYPAFDGTILGGSLTATYPISHRSLPNRVSVHSRFCLVGTYT